VVAQLLRLRLASLAGALRGDRRDVQRRVLGLIVLAAATAVAGYAILTLGDTSAAHAQVVTVLGGSAITVGFAVAPLVLGAVDPLDPRRFAVLALRPVPLSAALAGVGLLSVPIMVVLALAVCAAAMWAAHGADPALGVLSVVLGIVTCALLARVSEAVAALVVRERRSRELTGVFLVAVLVVVVPVGVFLASLEWRTGVPVQLREVVSVLQVTPLGAAWALPAVSGGDLGANLAVALLTVVVLGAAWVALVHRMLTTVERPAVARERGGLGWFAVAPGTQGGAIAARSLVYWLRDRRYLVNLVVVPIASVLTVIPLLVAGVPVSNAALVPVPIMALFFGWMPHNDVAYDSTAVWMHLASGVRGAADRIGRLVPILLIAIPVLAVAVSVATAIHGRWAILPALVGVSASLFLSGLGLSSISSAAAPYAVSHPGDSPFQQPQRTGAGGAIAQALVMIGAIVLSAPALWWAWRALTGDLAAATPALWAGLACGVVVLAAGIAIGAAVFERRGDRIMEFAEAA
jgi:ABC-2 type transport system permease protein